MNTVPTPPEDPADDPAPSGLASTVLRGAGISGGGYVLAQGLNLGVYIVLSRLLSPAEFGQYAAATVLIGFAVLFSESGMQAALIQRQDRLEEARNTALIAVIAGGLLATLIGLAAAPLLGSLFDSDQVTELALASAGLALINVLPIVPNSVLQRRFSILRLMVIDPVEVVVFGIVAIVAAANDLGPWSLVIGQYAALATGVVLSWILAGWLPRLARATFAMWRELAAYGRHVLLAGGIIKLGEQSADTLIVGKTLGTAALGQFRYAFRIAALPYMVLVTGAGYMVLPALSRLQADSDRLEAAFLRSLRWLAALGIPAGLALVPLGPGVAALVFGDVWLPAGYAAAAMCGYAGANAIVTAVAELLKAVGETSPLPRLYALSTVVTIVTMLALAQVSLTAAAASLSIGPTVAGVYALATASRVAGVAMRRTWAQIWPAGLAATAMALTVLPIDRLLLDPQAQTTGVGLALLALEAALCVITFVAFLALFAPATVREFWTEARSRLPGRFAR
ncbi:MAG: oligosaccharide flippase family protein [Vicinamibacteria bacterium]